MKRAYQEAFAISTVLAGVCAILLMCDLLALAAIVAIPTLGIYLVGCAMRRDLAASQDEEEKP